MEFVRKIIKKGLNTLGVEIKRFSKWEKDKYAWLEAYDINTILDIGANEGQFAQEIHEVFPNAFIYSFEPLSSCFERLQKNMDRVEKFKAFMFAIGDFNGEKHIYKNEFSPSSSILPMGKLHKEIFPFTQNMVKEKIAVRCLDDAVDEFNLHIKESILIKMDVQGYEDKVVFGGKDMFSKTSIIITEMSFVELYRGQCLFDGIYCLLKELGYIYAGNVGQLVNPQNGRPIQSDVIFLHKARLNL